ncbi:BA75_01136T0 [Komagataella pastoris]|uniref:BA75_01136T0 n=1 Tax=Komagataella pastoris TaxID=4922 RepID=A0A1B2J8G4_PICPA|nr:BA75_01136T0 [Komagataella pastoris]
MNNFYSRFRFQFKLSNCYRSSILLQSGVQARVYSRQYDGASPTKLLPWIENTQVLVEDLHSRKDMPFNINREIIKLPTVDKIILGEVKAHWGQYKQSYDQKHLLNYFTQVDADQMTLFWLYTNRLGISELPFYHKVVLRFLQGITPIPEKKINMAFIYQNFISLLFSYKIYDHVIYYHKQLYPLVCTNGSIINWLPIIQIALLNASKEDGNKSLKVLMELHEELDLRRDSFYEFIIPYLSKLPINSKSLFQWNKALVKNGDLPSKSSPHFTKVLSLLYKHKNIQAVEKLISVMGNANVSRLVSNRWMDTQTFIMFIKCINLTYEPQKTLDKFLNILKADPNLKSTSRWILLMKYTNKEKISFDYLKRKREQYISAAPLNLQFEECINIKEEGEFMKSFAKLVDSNKIIPIPVLSKFIEVMLKHDSYSSPSLENDFLFSESLKLLRTHIKTVDSGNLRASQRANRLIDNHLLVKGFVTGVLESETLTFITKMKLVEKVLRITHEAMPIISNSKELIKFRSYETQLVVNISLLFPYAMFKLNHLEQGLTHLEIIFAHIQKLPHDRSVTISPSITYALMECLSKFWTHMDKIDQRYSQKMDSYQINVTKIMFTALKLDQNSVKPETWRSLILCMLYNRPLEEVKTVLKWLIPEIETAGEKHPVLEVRNCSHPLRVIFNEKTISAFIRRGFKGYEGQEYKPWLPFQFLVEDISIKYGVPINKEKAKKDVKLGLQKLFSLDEGQVNNRWKTLRTHNLVGFEEMLNHYNNVWDKVDTLTYDT